MNDVLLVDKFQNLQHILQQINHLSFIEPLAPRHFLAQDVPFDVFLN